MHNVNSYDNKAGMSKQRTPISFDISAITWWSILYGMSNPLAKFLAASPKYKVLASCVEVPPRILAFCLRSAHEHDTS